MNIQFKSLFQIEIENIRIQDSSRRVASGECLMAPDSSWAAAALVWALGSYP